jgi:hypothetical protein
MVPPGAGRKGLVARLRDATCMLQSMTMKLFHLTVAATQKEGLTVPQNATAYDWTMLQKSMNSENVQ